MVMCFHRDVSMVMCPTHSDRLSIKCARSSADMKW